MVGTSLGYLGCCNRLDLNRSGSLDLQLPCITRNKPFDSWQVPHNITQKHASHVKRALENYRDTFSPLYWLKSNIFAPNG